MMKINKLEIDNIRGQFHKIVSKEDLLVVLNEANKILYRKNNNCNPILLQTLNFYAHQELRSIYGYTLKRYYVFKIKKKSGGERIINSPCSGLKSLLRALNLVLQCVYMPHLAATGFTLDKSIVDNARVHVGNHYVYNLDLKDFFYSFDRNRVKLGFMYKPFNLNKEREPIAFLLACLCTHPIDINGEIKNVLPQGAPTSPTISNILCYNLDKLLTQHANNFGAKYTRYADDITFSSPHNIYNKIKFKTELNRIIKEYSLLKTNKLQIGPQLTINSEKTRLQKSAYRQEVTGLVVNKKVNVRRQYIKNIRRWLYYWEKYGYEKANDIFNYESINEKYKQKDKNPSFRNVLNGKLEFIKMVKGNEDTTFKKLKQRFDKLTKENNDLNTQIEQKENRQKEQKLHKPEEIKNFLINFQESNSLKYLTHRFLGIKLPYSDFMESCKNEFNKAKNKYKNVQKNILQHVENFAFEKHPNWSYWDENNIVYCENGWSEESFVEWYEDINNPHPFDDEKYWKANMIIPFKNSIEVRVDSLDEMFNIAIGNTLKKDFEIIKDPKELNNANFYTDVNTFRSALTLIFTTIRDNSNREFNFKVSINYEVENEFKIIKITHVNSKANRDSKSLLGGDLKTIRSSLWGLCNYEIEANFTDGNKKKYILTDIKKNVNKSIDLKNEPKGFTHILKYY